MQMIWLLEKEYSAEYVKRYKRQPKYVPTGFVHNYALPDGIEVKGDKSRTWARNPKYNGSY